MEKREHAPLTLPKKVLSLAGFRENRNPCTPTKAEDNIDNPEVLNTNTNKGQAKKQKKKKKEKKKKRQKNKNKSQNKTKTKAMTFFHTNPSISFLFLISLILSSHLYNVSADDSEEGLLSLSLLCIM